MTTELERVGVLGMTVGELSGNGRRRGTVEVHRGAEYAADFVAKARIEVAVADELVERVIDAVVRGAPPGTSWHLPNWAVEQPLSFTVIARAAFSWAAARSRSAPPSRSR